MSFRNFNKRKKFWQQDWFITMLFLWLAAACLLGCETTDNNQDESAFRRVDIPAEDRVLFKEKLKY